MCDVGGNTGHGGDLQAVREGPEGFLREVTAQLRKGCRGRHREKLYDNGVGNDFLEDTNNNNKIDKLDLIKI